MSLSRSDIWRHCPSASTQLATSLPHHVFSVRDEGRFASAPENLMILILPHQTLDDTKPFKDIAKFFFLSGSETSSSRTSCVSQDFLCTLHMACVNQVSAAIWPSHKLVPTLCVRSHSLLVKVHIPAGTLSSRSKRYILQLSVTFYMIVSGAIFPSCMRTLQWNVFGFW